MDAGARCAVHMDREGIDECRRCGSYVCFDCMEVHEGQTYCSACMVRMGVKGEAGSRATTALILGLLPMFTCCVPLGIPAVFLGQAELAAIERGESPAAGKNLAQGAVILGWINVALMGIGIITAVAMMAMS